MDFSIQEVATRMLVGTFLCGLIGVEREMRKKPAGVQANALVGLGATVMSMCGLYISSQFPGMSDPSRIASIVVQGIGFIGAGVIINSSGEVHGLTTAATMWLVAGIGIAVGFGFYSVAVVATLIAFVLLIVFGALEARIVGDRRNPVPQSTGKPFDKKR